MSRDVLAVPPAQVAPTPVPLAQVPPAALEVELVVCAQPGRWRLWTLTLPAGARVVDALRAARMQDARWWAALGDAAIDALAPSIWGRACAADAPLADGDRLALTRALTVDPKQARRLRFARDGLRKRVRPPRKAAADKAAAD